MGNGNGKGNWLVALLVVTLLVGFGAFQLGKNKGAKVAPVTVTQTEPAKAPEVAKTPEVSKPTTALAVAQASVAPAPVAVASKAADARKIERKLEALEILAKRQAAEAAARDAQLAKLLSEQLQAPPAPAMQSENYGATGNITGSGIAAASSVVASVPSFALAKNDGGDTLVHDSLIRQIPCFDPSKPVIAATHSNGWLVRGASWATEGNLKATIMNKEGDWWRACGMANLRFHPVQQGERGEPLWAKIENLFPGLDQAWIDMSEGTPCVRVKL